MTRSWNIVMTRILRTLRCAVLFEPVPVSPIAGAMARVWPRAGVAGEGGLASLLRDSVHHRVSTEHASPPHWVTSLCSKHQPVTTLGPVLLVWDLAAWCGCGPVSWPAGGCGASLAQPVVSAWRAGSRRRPWLGARLPPPCALGLAGSR